MKYKTKVGVIFGGKSAEHEVSLQSAKNIIEAIDKDKYDVVLIGIDKSGKWYLNDDTKYLLNSDNPKQIKLYHTNEELGLIPGDDSKQLYNVSRHEPLDSVDVIFPVLHGPFGEDGTIQGLLKLANIPFVGAGVLGSAVGMDKDVMKRLLRDAGVPIGDFLVYTRSSKDKIDYDNVQKRLGSPVFVKPANLGSSVGVSKAKDKTEFDDAVNIAFEYDNKIIIEENIEGREIECSVLGNDEVSSFPVIPEIAVLIAAPMEPAILKIE